MNIATEVILVLNLLAIPNPLSGYIATQAPGFLVYENDDFKFSILYPTDWKKEEETVSKSSNINIVVSFVKQSKNHITTEADLYVKTEEFLGKNITLEKFAQIQKAYTAPLLGVSSFNEAITIIENRPAWQLEYTFKGIGGTIRQGMNNLIINDDIGFSVVFTADKERYDRYFPIAQKMINSFQTSIK